MKKSDGKLITLGIDVDTGKPFTFPVAGAATKTLGVFGKKGSGKTWTAAVWVEQLLGHKIPVVILDPVGRWWDLGVGADLPTAKQAGGRSPGFPIAIFGGQHGQVALTADMGRAIARYVAERHVPTVVDLSYESKTTWRRVIADFCEELFRVNQLPVHVIIEEAPEFIPQRVFGENATVFGAVDKLVRLGRNRGIGMTAIGQRLQTTNKDTLSQVDALVVMRLVDPHGKKAAREWVAAKGESAAMGRDARADDFVDALASLPSGTGFIWSPEWLETFARVRFAARTTFHYDADRAAEETLPAGEIAQAVDTQELRQTFAKFMEPSPGTGPAATARGKSDVVAARRIAELQQQVESLTAALESAQAQAVTDEEIEHRIQLTAQNATSEMRSRLAQFEGYVSNMLKQGQALLDGSAVADASILSRGVAAPQLVAEYVAKQAAYYKSRTATKILQTLADNYSRFLAGMTAEEIATEAGYDPFGGRYRGMLQQLVRRRVIVKEGEHYLLNPAHLK